MSADDFVARARALFLDGRHADAVRVCRLGLLAQPAAHAGRMVLANALLSLGRFDEVLNEMRVVLAARPNDAGAMALKGEALMRKGDRRQALEVLSRGKVLDPLSARITGLLDELARMGVRSLAPPPEPDPDAGVPEEVSPSGEFSARFAALMPRAGSIDMSSEPTKVPRAPSVAVEIASSDLLEVSETDGPTGIRRGLLPPESTAPPGPRLAKPTSSPAVRPAGKQGPADRADARPGAPKGLAPGGVSPEGRIHEDEPTHVAPQRPQSQPRLAIRPAPRPTPPPPPPPRSALPGAGTRPMPPRLADFAPGETETSAPTGVRGEPEREDATRPELASDDWNRLPTGLASALDALEISTPVPPPALPPPLPAPTPTRESLPTRPEASVPSPRQALPSAPPLNAPREAPSRRRTSQVQPRASGGRAGAEARVQGGRPLVWILAFLLVAGGAVGGWFWRQARIAGRVSEVAGRARAAGARQTYRGAAEARALWSTAETAAPDDRAVRAGHAHAEAAFAFELGDPLTPAAALVAKISDDARGDALLARAYVALAGDDDDAALAAARVARSALPDEPEAAYILGRALLVKDDLDGAITALTEAARMPSPRARVWLAFAQADAGHMEAALATLAQAPPDHPLVVIAGASLAARAGSLGTRAPAVKRELEALLADQAGNVPALGPAERRLGELALGEVALASGDPEAARAHFEAVENTDAGDQRHDAEARFAAWLAMGDKERARQVAGATARAHPGWPGASRMLGELALLDGQPTPALVVLARVSGARAEVLRGRAHLALGQLDDAARELDAALAQRAGDREANLARAGIDWKRGDARAVVLRLEPLWKAGADPEVGVLYGAALRVTGDRDGARAVLERATQDPRGQEGWLDLARVYRAEGKLTAAQEAYAKALTRAPDSVDVRLELALVAFDGGDAERARAALDTLASEKPNELPVLLACARLRSATGDTRGARACLAQAGPLATTVVQRGALAREQGRASLVAGEGARALAELGRTAIDDGEGRLLYLDAALMQDDARRMAAVVAEIGKTFAGRPEADVARAKVQMAAGDYEHARATFATAEGVLTQAGAPPRVIAEVRAQAARAELDDGEAESASKTAATAIALDGWNALAHFVLGQALLTRGQPKEARPELERATLLRPGDADFWYFLAETCVRLRDLPAAKKAARASLVLQPRGTYARNAKSILRLR